MAVIIIKASSTFYAEREIGTITSFTLQFQWWFPFHMHSKKCPSSLDLGQATPKVFWEKLLLLFQIFRTSLIGVVWTVAIELHTILVHDWSSVESWCGGRSMIWHFHNFWQIVDLDYLNAQVARTCYYSICSVAKFTLQLFPQGSSLNWSMWKTTSQNDLPLTLQFCFQDSVTQHETKTLPANSIWSRRIVLYQWLQSIKHYRGREQEERRFVFA